MTILLFGPRGYLGRQFRSLYPEAMQSDADIADPSAVAAVLDMHRPELVVNAAGKTGRPNVDWCEDHKIETIRGNITGPLVLMEECAKRGIYWVHLSSGCIYEGDNGGQGYSEDDAPNFDGSFYARSKAQSERLLLECADAPEGRGGILILRLRMPFDGSLNERSLVMKLRRYEKVLDAKNSITFLPDFLKAASVLVERRRTGLYNVVNPGVISPLRIMEMYREIVDPGHFFVPLSLADLGMVARAARSNCMLSTKKLEEEGIRLLSIETAVLRALASLKLQLPLAAAARK